MALQPCTRRSKTIDTKNDKVFLVMARGIMADDRQRQFARRSEIGSDTALLLRPKILAPFLAST